MSRETSPREDMLAEATTLAERASFAVDGQSEPIVVGFRRDGGISFYFGDDPVYQFNVAGQLRRAFASDLIYKAEQGRLVSLRREKQSDSIALVRHELTTAETNELLETMNQRLAALFKSLENHQFELLGQIPAHLDLALRIRNWLEQHSGKLTIAERPNAGD